MRIKVSRCSINDGNIDTFCSILSQSTQSKNNNSSCQTCSHDAHAAFELDDFISGLKPQPSKFVEVVLSDGSKETIINKEYTTWRKADKLLLLWLFSTISLSLIGEVTSCVTSFEAWNVLKCLYPQQSLAKVLQLKWQMQNVKKGSSSVSEFVLKVEGIGNALRGA
ncbi:hypothetical protein ACOSQ2_014182 [Xanthoceras sorbifolium]